MIWTLLALFNLLSGDEKRISPPSPTLLVPAYFYPKGAGEKDWRRMIADSKRASITAIMNPASGPGTERNADYVRILKAAEGSRLRIIAYVDLGYAKRTLQEIKADCDRWRRLYPQTTGFFFDQQPSDAVAAKFVGECVDHARTLVPKGTIVCNPGVVCDAAYASQKTTLCLFEHEKGFERWSAPDWAKSLDPRRVFVLLYSVDRNRWKAAFDGARAKGAGTLFVTDEKGPMPWGRLPSYWPDEVAAAAKSDSSPETKKQ